MKFTTKDRRQRCYVRPLAAARCGPAAVSFHWQVFSLLLASGMFLHPENVLVLGAGNVKLQSRSQRWHSAWVAPFMNFGMAIGKREATGAIMITCRKINNGRFGDVGIAIHLDYKISIIDTILAFIQ